VREAKLHTSWIDPDTAYDEHLDLYLDGVLADSWLADELARFDDRIRRPARMVSLSQKALQLMVPGVPDIYQECERCTFAWWTPTTGARSTRMSCTTS